MSTLGPYFPSDAVCYVAEDDRILIINPETRAWTITNASGKMLLESFDGTRSNQRIAESLGLSSKQRSAFRQFVSTLLQQQILVQERDAYLRRSQSPCACDGPGSLHLEITNRCNLKCTHCYVSAGKQKPNELTFDEICAVVNDFKAISLPRPLGAIGITGGEARLRPDCIEIIAYCREQGFQTVLFTDGVGLPVPFVKRLTELESWIQVSLDGPDPETNDPVRGKGTFKQITSGIELLLKNGFGPRLTLFVTLTRQSIDRALEMVHYADEMGIGTIHFSQLNSQGRATGLWREIAPTSEQWISFGRRFLEQGSEHVRIKGNVFGGLDKQEGLFPKMRCEIPSSPRIDCQGNVFPCQLFLAPEHCIGNVREQSLGDILKGLQLQEIAAKSSARSAVIPRCKSCEWRPLCHSGCPGHAYSEFRTLEHEDSLCDVRLFWFEAAAREILQLPPLAIPEGDKETEPTSIMGFDSSTGPVNISPLGRK